MTTTMRAMSSSVCRGLLVVMLFFIVMQEGLGLPLSVPSPASPEPPARTAQPHRVRTKRCSCNSWLDKECIYFCHLDIIWVNTPSKIVPYGLGSIVSQRRGRRAASRCECARGHSDAGCSSFCHDSSESPEAVTAHAGKNRGGSSLLAALRSAVHVNAAAVQNSRPGTPARPSEAER